MNHVFFPPLPNDLKSQNWYEDLTYKQLFLCAYKTCVGVAAHYTTFHLSFGSSWGQEGAVLSTHTFGQPSSDLLPPFPLHSWPLLSWAQLIIRRECPRTHGGRAGPVSILISRLSNSCHHFTPHTEHFPGYQLEQWQFPCHSLQDSGFASASSWGCQLWAALGSAASLGPLKSSSQWESS